MVTAKYEPNADACLAHVGLEVDAVFGWRFGPAKGETLAGERADVYVGDTQHDVTAARAAGSVAVAVASGPHDESEHAAVGADVVLDSLTGFAEWLAVGFHPVTQRAGGTSRRTRGRASRRRGRPSAWRRRPVSSSWCRAPRGGHRVRAPRGLPHRGEPRGRLPSRWRTSTR